MKALVLLVTWLALVAAQAIPKDGDPCMFSQYLTLSEPGRSMEMHAMSRAMVMDDSNLIEFWYRFTNPTGAPMGSLSETCPPYGCTSMGQAWLKDTHPADDGELHSKKVCVNNGVECESHCFFVLVKNCSSFYVYKLKGLPGDTAYCSGSGSACPTGKISPTGYTPCAAPADIPAPPTAPTVGLVTETKNFSLTCTFTSPSAEALHEVRWIAGGNNFLSKTLAAGERTATATEFELFYRGSTVVGNSVMCEVRAYKEGIPVGTAWVSSPAPGYFLGIKVVDIHGNEVLEVEIDEDSKTPKLVFLKTTVPVRCNSAKWNNDLIRYFWITEADCEVNARVVNKDFEDFARQLHGDCPPESQETLKTIAGQLEFESCAVKLKPDTWEEHTNNILTIRAVKDKVFDGRQSRYVSFQVDVDYQDVWKGYEFPYLKVTALDTRQPNVGTSTCTSYNDPHLKTFDGTVYHNYNEGEYVLYENLEFNFRIHAYYKTCNTRKDFHASCNCGVAAQAGNDVILLDRCRKFGDIIYTGDNNLDDKTYLRQRVIQRGDMTQGFTLEHVSGTKIYKIKFPHGAILTLTLTDTYDKQFVNLEMAPSQLDYSDDGIPKTQGLCGVFSRDQADDMRLPDGRTYQQKDSDFKNLYKQFIPDDFSLAWKIASGSSKSMYNGKISDATDYSGHRFCACVNNAKANNTAEVLCAFGDDCRTLQDITDIVGKRTGAKRKRREAGAVADNDYFMDGFDDSTWDFSFSNDNYLSKVKNLYETVAVVVPVVTRTLNRATGTFVSRATGAVETKLKTIENSPWPTESGKTEQYAKDFCTNYVRNSEAVKACESIPDVNFQHDIDMCVSDIALSDTTDFAISAVQSIVTKCSEKVNSDMRLWTPNTDPRTNSTMRTAPPAVTSNMCPNDCSMNGVCRNGKCTCNAGFTGADCSGDATQPPSIRVLAGGGRCDYSRRMCKATPVIGDNFIDGASLKCRFQVAELTQNGPVGNGEVLETEPEFESYMEIHCPFPSAHITARSGNPPPRGYIFSITNDGQVMSNTMPSIVYDGSRYSCPSVQGACTAGNQ